MDRRKKRKNLLPDVPGMGKMTRNRFAEGKRVVTCFPVQLFCKNIITFQAGKGIPDFFVII